MDTSSNQPTSKQDYTSVNIEDPELRLAADDIKKRQNDLHPISTAACIYRVPPSLRQVSEKSYTPQTVSIGPFHHGKKELGPWEEYKLRYLQAFLDRTEKSLEDCIKLVKDWEVRARNCYKERIDLESREFVNMMLVDSCFIIEAMWRVKYKLGETTDYLNNPDLISIVDRDLVLLENQLPFFVLNGLYELGFGEDGEDDFLELSIGYFSDLFLTVTEEGGVERTFTNVKGLGFEIKHFTDLLRICHLPTHLKKPNTGDFVPIPTAARLQEAGMKFKIGPKKRLLDMEYNTSGLLEMPMFKVEDNTECLLKNLIALETCHYPFDSYIIDYVFFMDDFIDSAKDVDLLIQKGIIVNYLSDSASVASLFNNLGMETALFSPYYFKVISEAIKAYYDDPWHNKKATLKRDYCSSPWKTAATLAAIAVVLLTLISTICSIISLL